MKEEYVHVYYAPFGRLTAVSDGEFLTGLWFRNSQPDDAIQIPDKEGKIPVFEQTRRWLDQYFEGKEPDFCPKLRLEGSNFARKVWKILTEIPYGTCMTYGDIAGILTEKGSKKRMSPQAVGHAVGSNPVAIIVPCHRVIGAGGKLTGYGGGMDVKKYLLRIEGHDMEKFRE